MAKNLSPKDRRRIADLAGIHHATLYQAMSGKGFGLSPQEAVRIEELTNREIRRWDLRPKDWWLVWPELRNRKGAPPRPRLPSDDREGLAATADAQ